MTLIFNAISVAARALLIAMALVLAMVRPGNALVDLKNANYSNTWIDLPEKLGVSILRTYNSRSLFAGIFGFGWCSDFETSIYFSDNGSYKLSFCGDGQTLEFERPQRREGSGRALSSDDGSTLEISDEQFLYRSADGQKTLHFDRMGHLSAIETSGFGTVEIIRLYGRVTEVVDWEGRRYRFLIGSAGKVLRIQTPESLVIEYQYNQFGDLVAVKNGWGNVYRFHYDELHNLVRASWPDKTFIAIDYDKERDWVTGFTDRDVCKEAYAYKQGLSPRGTEVYWVYITKHCKEELIVEGLYEFVYTREPLSGPGRLWKVRVSSGLPGPNGVDFTETVHPETGPPIITREKRDSLHTPLLRPQ
ncbi:DUF6531 domain-containing protein [Sinorhizobium prairiense]|jgi:YD repeat-containing protein|uniref:DUF6531 domain-containing protein n=1 Tax=unclassified Sinorhizobium TaxID=2613772 RepID=UPI0023D8248B|nr:MULTISPECIES: DUF6531 domain-containing protein [unclassified Sinorhizobium]WEJ11744.1 DUF6531 domain-containing protein [Sinorhizobium sp. M103]WEJ17607.1 DUF6531 domain-containing protein [Sinorhizobium sp. K101]WEJ40442.1 DUF6531 domain-containing protein [Sinorhizobium sp. C101]